MRHWWFRACEAAQALRRLLARTMDPVGRPFDLPLTLKAEHGARGAFLPSSGNEELGDA